MKFKCVYKFKIWLRLEKAACRKSRALQHSVSRAKTGSDQARSGSSVKQGSLISSTPYWLLLKSLSLRPLPLPPPPRKYRAANWTWRRLCSSFINFYLWRERIDFPRVQPRVAGAHYEFLQTFPRLASPLRPTSPFFHPLSAIHPFPHMCAPPSPSLLTKQVIYNRPPLLSCGEQELRCPSFHNHNSSFTHFSQPLSLSFH